MKITTRFFTLSFFGFNISRCVRRSLKFVYKGNEIKDYLLFHRFFVFLWRKKHTQTHACIQYPHPEYDIVSSGGGGSSSIATMKNRRIT